uniref:Metallophosphoesterase 1 homolog n=1 Tax=Caenorhabditis japonica TaxID=281687 RepID=A0A8R1HMF8_CAEJA
MRCQKSYGLLILLALLLILYNEYFIFFYAFYKCQWSCHQNRCPENGLKAFIISDTHLLGQRNGHWLDKLKREWQMRQSYHISTWLHTPDVVFFLGDLLDEGQWAGRTLFSTYAQRFRRLFSVDEKVIALAGNHDLGFHYVISPDTVDQFKKEFQRDIIDEIQIKNHSFILINSMAMHGDMCGLCREAEKQLEEIAKRNRKNRPIVLQHFPLFRKSDKSCQKLDEYHVLDHKEQYRERWDTLSQEASQKIAEKLHPRAVFGGHTHKLCKRSWNLRNGESFYEYTLNSFSWRNGDLPAIFMVVIEDQNVSKRRPRAEPGKQTTHLNPVSLSNFVPSPI